ncbi:MAG: WbqC family protein [Candidatus Thiodiazotropha sp. (ex Monitilora ramsayi)]|nr:WbqC family protein [Candidatus Thiodiazotropha sp. (ex Monitilora ramsayi)]
MLLSDIQPQYFPRLHFFARMLASDHFVIRDDVQFVKNHKFPDGSRGVSHQVHTPILTHSGTQLLTVFVKKGGMLPINQTLISYDQPWPIKHLNQLKPNYAKSPELLTVYGEIESLLKREYETVSDLNIATICWALCHLMKIETNDPECLTLEYINTHLEDINIGKLKRITLGSSIKYGDDDEGMTASEKIVDLCNRYGATGYLAGNTAFESYLDQRAFHDSNIKVQVQNWSCQPYKQNKKANEEFIPNLSILDLIMNCSSERALEILLFA